MESYVDTARHDLAEAMRAISDTLLQIERCGQSSPSQQSRQAQFTLDLIGKGSQALGRASSRLERLVDALGYRPAHTCEDVRNVIAESIQRRRAVWITYTDRNGESSEREVEPFWIEGDHMRGYCRSRRCARRFLLQRVSSASLSDSPFRSDPVE
jgi:predicted DNA-binding transcriptional regulator YafY